MAASRAAEPLYKNVWHIIPLSTEYIVVLLQAGVKYLGLLFSGSIPEWRTALCTLDRAAFAPWHPLVAAACAAESVYFGVWHGISLVVVCEEDQPSLLRRVIAFFSML